MRLCSVLALGVLALASFPSPGPEVRSGRVAAAQPPAPPDFVPPAFLGKVVAVTKEGVTIKPEGDLKIPAITFDENRKERVKWVYVQDNKQPPRTFRFTNGLLYLSGLRPVAGGEGLSPVSGHLIPDLQAGDVVSISCGRTAGIDYCGDILITDRPGGKVPPTVLDKQRAADTRPSAKQAEKAIAVMGRLGLRLLR